MNYHYCFSFKTDFPSDLDFSPHLDLDFNSDGLLCVSDSKISFQFFTESGRLITKKKY